MLRAVQLWNDYQLQWEPANFGGISVIRILSHKVWKPDIVLFNKYATTFYYYVRCNIIAENRLQCSIL